MFGECAASSASNARRSLSSSSLRKIWRATVEDVILNEVGPTHLLQCVRLQGCHGGLQEMAVGNGQGGRGGCADKGDMSVR